LDGSIGGAENDVMDEPKRSGPLEYYHHYGNAIQSRILEADTARLFMSMTWIYMKVMPGKSNEYK